MKTSGAEAIITLNDEGYIEKSRIKKSYRISPIDDALRISRTRKEERILRKLEKIIPVPRLHKVSDTDIIMENIVGIQIKKILDARPQLAMIIGENLALMHDADVIHGDLTTSNMILSGAEKSEKIFFIDFGLSFVSNRVEDKAVDIHLFKQALESKHHTVAQVAYEQFLSSYYPKDRKEILQRLQVVEQRGRYKEKA